MTSIADGSVNIQTTSESRPSLPSWFGEGVVIVSYLRKRGILTKISKEVRFARRRFGHDEVIDFLAVLAGLRDQRGTHAGGSRKTPPACVPFMAGAGA